MSSIVLIVSYQNSIGTIINFFESWSVLLMETFWIPQGSIKEIIALFFIFCVLKWHLWPNYFLVFASEFFIRQILEPIMCVVVRVLFQVLIWNFKNFAVVGEELTVVFLIYILLCFTDWMPNLEVRHSLGFAFISTVMAILVVFHFTALLMKLFKLIKWIRRKLYIKNQKRLA